MRGLLIRIGIDQAYGNWNAPIDPSSGKFGYVPIPEGTQIKFKPGMNRSYQEIEPRAPACNVIDRSYL